MTTTATSAPSVLQRILSPPRVTVLRYVAWLVVPLAAMVLGCKAHKLIAQGAGISGFFAGIGADLAFLAALGIGLTMLLRLPWRWARLPARVLAHALTLTVALLTGVEHGFFVVTGSILDYFALSYGLENMGMLKDVYLSEMGAGVFIAGGGLVLMNLLPVFVCRGQSFAALDDGWPDAVRWRGPPVARYAKVAIGGLAAGLVLGLLPMPDASEPLRTNVFIAFAQDSLGGGSFGPSAIAEHGQIVPLELHRREPDALRKNVVFIVLESTRARSTTPYNPEIDTTPFLDSLAERGTLVEDAYTVVPHTSKALVGLLCGAYPKIVTPIDEASPGGVPGRCLARVLGERGYATAFIQPATRTFEARAGLVDNFGYRDFYSQEDLPTEGFEVNSYFGLEDDAMIGPSLEWIDAQGEQPFFMTILTLTPHHTYDVPSDFESKHYEGDEELVKYLNTMRYMDRFLSQLFEGFEARGLMEDTIFVIAGDHGEGFGEHGRFQHDNVIYQEGMRVPMLLLGARDELGGRVGGLRQTIDLMPTLLDLLGYDVKSGLAGKSLRDPSGHERLMMSCWYHNRCMGLREGDMKFVYHYGRRGVEVFDLAADPLERDNIAADVGNDRTREWTGALLDWKAAVNHRYEAQSEMVRKAYITDVRPTPQRPMNISLGGLVRVIGVDARDTVISEGQPLQATIYFESVAPTGTDWRLFTHVLGATPEATRFANADHVPGSGHYPLDQWRPGQFVIDPINFEPRPPLAPGRYSLAVGLWNVTAKGGPEVTRIALDGDGARFDDERRVHLLDFTVTKRRAEKRPETELPAP